MLSRKEIPVQLVPPSDKTPEDGVVIVLVRIPFENDVATAFMKETLPSMKEILLPLMITVEYCDPISMEFKKVVFDWICNEPPRVVALHNPTVRFVLL